MKEIGGYFELDTYHLPMLHEGAVALNCGRNALAYLIEARKIRKICLPYFLCSSIKDVCSKYDVKIRYYHIDWNFIPKEIEFAEDEWLYLVNYYGQLSTETVQSLCDQYQRVIVDNAQHYYEMPLDGIDTIYTCRKYFGVADGAFLYTDAKLDRKLEQDESYAKMEFVLGRYDRNASDFYSLSTQNNKMFAAEPIKLMSRLTDNLLHGINYEFARNRRINNFRALHEALYEINKLKLSNGPSTFMYPLLIENGAVIRRQLQAQKIFAPTLWPNVLDDVAETEIEWNMASNIFPIPCDQRYDQVDIKYIIRMIKIYIK